MVFSGPQRRYSNYDDGGGVSDVISLARWLVVLGAFCAPLPLAAQSAPPPDAASGKEIVVTGKTEKPSSDEVFEEARGVSRVGPHQDYVVALPRFWAPVCPGVAGLRTASAESMVDRMRENLARLKVPLAKEGCSPNLVVAFADDGRTLLSSLDDKRPFELISQSERAEMLTDPKPVHVWNNIAPRWTGQGHPPRDWLHASVWGQLDRTSMPVSYDIVSALVVFDREAVLGMTLAQLADYATMRGLSHTRPASGDQPMATILSLFDEGGGAGPDELTSFDVGYLRSLYWDQPNASAAHKLLDVQRWAEKHARAAAAGSPASAGKPTQK
jgi:hypothetical protein